MEAAFSVAAAALATSSAASAPLVREAWLSRDCDFSTSEAALDDVATSAMTSFAASTAEVAAESAADGDAFERDSELRTLALACEDAVLLSETAADRLPWLAAFAAAFADAATAEAVPRLLEPLVATRASCSEALESREACWESAAADFSAVAYVPERETPLLRPPESKRLGAAGGSPPRVSSKEAAGGSGSGAMSSNRLPADETLDRDAARADLRLDWRADLGARMLSSRLPTDDTCGVPRDDSTSSYRLPPTELASFEEMPESVRTFSLTRLVTALTRERAAAAPGVFRTEATLSATSWSAAASESTAAAVWLRDDAAAMELALRESAFNSLFWEAGALDTVAAICCDSRDASRDSSFACVVSLAGDANSPDRPRLDRPDLAEAALVETAVATVEGILFSLSALSATASTVLAALATADAAAAISGADGAASVVLDLRLRPRSPKPGYSRLTLRRFLDFFFVTAAAALAAWSTAASTALAAPTEPDLRSSEESFSPAASTFSAERTIEFAGGKGRNARSSKNWLSDVLLAGTPASGRPAKKMSSETFL